MADKVVLNHEINTSKNEGETPISRLVELARKELLDKGYTPEQVEALLNRRRARDPLIDH